MRIRVSRLLTRGPIALVRGALWRTTPLYVQFSVTDRCNLACRMCGASSASAGRAELSLPEIERLADVLRHMGVRFLVLTGGEPLLRTDLPGIIETFARKGIPARLQSNGVLATREKVRELVDSGLEEVTVSLDSLDPATQDLVTGRPGSFAEIINGLYAFASLLPRHGNLSAINTVVSRLNILEIPAIVKFATDIGFLISLIPLHHGAKEAGFSLRREADALRFRDSDFASIDSTYSELLRLKRAGALIFNSRRFLRASVDYLKFQRVSWRCDSPDLYFSIGADGTLCPCVDRPGLVSMLGEDFLKDYPKHRRRAREIATGCPGCMYACYPEVSWMCRSFADGVERLRQGAKLARLHRPVTKSADDLFAIARRHRSGPSVP